MRTHVALGVLVSVVLACSPVTPTLSPSADPSLVPATPTPEVVCLGGCGDDGYPREAGVDGGRLVVGSVVEAHTFNPFDAARTSAINAMVAAATWAGLTVVDDNLHVKPNLALGVPTIDNGGVRVPGGGGAAMSVTWQL